ncbi:glycosyltransferase [Desulfohalovibrio reitneri]|uniref:glycosyltransferase n=1 Tax=Desulfohalovibrio reitneri TaxID=1307759 RepID=UPI000AA40304|nr:glycosyltransferase [Desulfohalovibrio reitneri]
MPRIAHLIATNFYGGPERQILWHARHLSKRGYQPLIVSFQEHGKENELLLAAGRAGVDHRGLKARSPFHPGSVYELARLLRRDGVRVLVTHGYKANVVGRLASWLTGIPEVAVSRGWTGENGRVRLYEKLDKLFLRLADQVVAVSGGQREKVLACGVPGERVCVIHNGIDLESFPGPCEHSVRRELGVPDDAPFVVSAGRLSPEKNHMGFIEAAGMVLTERPDTRFAVFGEGFLRPELERAVAELELEDRFFLPGFRPDVRSLLHEADVFVLPSHTEGLPNVILEAFACGKPVVATAVGGTPEVVRHGVDGFLTRPNDPGALSEALLALIDSPELRAEMGGNGLNHVRERFDFADQTNRYLEHYQRLLETNSRGEGRA